MSSEKKIITYKAFDKDFKCRGFQYEIGKEYSVPGKIKACQNGFHACENPLDVLDYYDLVGSRFARVEQYGDIDTDENKTALAKIKVEVELTLPQFIKSAVDYAFQKIGFDKLIKEGKEIEGVNASSFKV